MKYVKFLNQDLKNIYYCSFQYGRFTVCVASSDRGAVMVKIGFSKEQSYSNELQSFVQKSVSLEDRKHNEDLVRAIGNYFRGDNQSTYSPGDIHMSPFMYDVYRTACKIPYGEIRTHKDIAFMAGASKGVRAAG